MRQTQSLALAAAFVLSLAVAPFGWADESGAIEWIRQFGTTGGSTDLAQAVAIDGSGNVYVVGQVFGTLAGQTSAGAGDAYVRKYDAFGTLIWTRQIGTTGNDIAFAVFATAADVYVGGSVRGALPGFSFAGIEDAFLRKYDASGSLVWTDQFGSTDLDQIRGIAVDNSVSPTAVYVAGQAVGALPGQASLGGNDAFVRKYGDSGSAVSVAWTRQFGTAAVDIGFSIALDATGIYVAGRTDGNLDGTNAGIFDAFARKYDASGSMIWTRQFGTSVADIAFGVAADLSGVYVVGQTDADLDGPGSGIHAGNQDAFVRKYDASGSMIWTRQFGTSAIDVAFAVSVDAAGLHVAGRTDGDLDGAGPGTFAGVGDAFVQTYDTSGSLLWRREVGSLAFDQALGISGDGSIVYVVGQADRALPGETVDNGSNTDAFLRKYDVSGNDLWTNRFGTLGPVADFAQGVAHALDQDGNIYVAGDTRGTLPGQTAAGLNDAFVRKYDRDGNEVWTRQFGSPLNDFALAVAVDARGRLYVVGRSETAQLGQTFAGGLSDAYVRAFDLNGNDIWTRQFGTNAFDNLTAVAVDPRGGAVYAVGVTSGTLPGQPPVSGIQDAFVRKYDADGTELWTREFGSLNSDLANGVAVNAKGDVYVVGQTFGTLPGQRPVSGASDAFIRKYDARGKELWTRQFGSSLIDLANAVAAEPGPAGDVYVAGSVGAALPGQTFGGGTGDAFLRKYDKNGKEIWTREFGTSLFDQVRAVSADAARGVYVGGDVGAALAGQTSAGLADAFVQKYDPDGNEVWTFQLGSSQRDSIGGLSVLESVVAVGDTDGALLGQTSTGDADAFVVKIVEVPRP